MLPELILHGDGLSPPPVTKLAKSPPGCTRQRLHFAASKLWLQPSSVINVHKHHTFAQGGENTAGRSAPAAVSGGSPTLQQLPLPWAQLPSCTEWPPCGRGWLPDAVTPSLLGPVACALRGTLPFSPLTCSPCLALLTVSALSPKPSLGSQATGVLHVSQPSVGDC